MKRIKNKSGFSLAELLITVGYPAAEPVKGKRRPLDEVVFREQWGGKDE